MPTSSAQSAASRAKIASVPVTELPKRPPPWLVEPSTVGPFATFAAASDAPAAAYVVPGVPRSAPLALPFGADEAALSRRAFASLVSLDATGAVGAFER